MSHLNPPPHLRLTRKALWAHSLPARGCFRVASSPRGASSDMAGSAVRSANGAGSRRGSGPPWWGRATALLALLAVLTLGAAATAAGPGDQEPPVRLFTDADIAGYNGDDPAKPLYMAVKGVVFDVSTGKEFYGKGNSYNALAGRDSTRAVAKMSLAPEDLTSDTSGLSQVQLESLEKVFSGVYKAKYPIVGYMSYRLLLPDGSPNPDFRPEEQQLKERKEPRPEL